MEKSPLEQIFESSDEDVETFVSAISDHIQVDDPFEAGLKNGQPQQIKAPEFVFQQSGPISIEHGWDDLDYVWHIATHPKRPFKVNEFRLLYAIAKIMNPYIPSECEVKIWRPYAEWDIQEYTFKAMGLKNFWQFKDSDILIINTQLFEVLNSLT
jgi:hypothetical protein